MSELILAFNTPKAWVDAVLADFDTFLLDHAAAEKKASGMAVSMISHYPDRIALVTEMANLAVEEMAHFREVIKLIHQRGNITGKDDKDHYVLKFRKAIRDGSDAYFLDRLLVAGIIEARGAERFGLIAAALEPSEVKDFYQAITESEKRHENLFVEMAELYFDEDTVNKRLQELLAIEADIVRQLPIRAALH